MVGSGLPPSLEQVRAAGSFSLAMGFGGVILGSPGGTERKKYKYRLHKISYLIYFILKWLDIWLLQAQYQNFMHQTALNSNLYAIRSNNSGPSVLAEEIMLTYEISKVWI